MNIYINTTKQPPMVSADSLGLQSTSALAFKRGTTVVLNVFLKGEDVDAGNIVSMRFGLKLKDKYDDFLCVYAETTQAPEQTDSGWKFTLKPHFSATAIDTALGVGNAPDVAKAQFISEFEWVNADGEVSASATIATTMHNNIVRELAEGVAPSLIGDYVALMVMRISWAEYLALQNKSPECLYLIPDAPDELAAIRTELIERIEGCVTTDALAGIVNAFVPKTQRATATQAGIVRLGSDVTFSSSSSPIGTTAEGQLVTPGATPNMLGAVTLKTQHSGLTFAGNSRLAVNTADSNTHPAAGTAGPCATDANGKLVVLTATQTIPGAVYIATSTADERPGAVMAASQLKDYLNLINMSIATLAERVTALESAGS